MSPKTIAALVGAGREREGVAIDAADRSGPYSYREFCTNTWKAGNLLGHYTHPGGSVAVVPGPKEFSNSGDVAVSSGPAAAEEGSIDSADPVLAALGGALLGTRVELTAETPVGTDALVRPAGAAWGERYPAQAGCAVLAYGGPPEPSSVEHFEAALWSENPVEPPESVKRATPAVRAGGETHSHGDLLDGAAAAVDRHDLDGESRVLLAGDLRDPGVLVAGVLAPLSVGATIVLGGDTAAGDADVLVDESEGRKY